MPAALLFVFSTEKRDGRVVLCFWPAARATRPGRPSPMPGGWSWVGGIPPPAGLIVLYNDDAPAPKLNVGYNSQPKMRASGQAGRRPAGVLGAWVRAARVVGHTKTSPPGSCAAGLRIVIRIQISISYCGGKEKTQIAPEQKTEICGEHAGEGWPGRPFGHIRFCLRNIQKYSA